MELTGKRPAPPPAVPRWIIEGGECVRVPRDDEKPQKVAQAA